MAAACLDDYYQDWKRIADGDPQGRQRDGLTLYQAKVILRLLSEALNQDPLSLIDAGISGRVRRSNLESELIHFPHKYTRDSVARWAGATEPIEVQIEPSKEYHA